MKLTAKAQITGKVVYVNGIKEFGEGDKRGKLLSGLIQTFDESKKEGGKPYNYFSIEFVAYNEMCDRMKFTEVKDIITIEGDLRTNFHNNAQKPQLKVEKAEVLGRMAEELPKPKKKQEEGTFTIDDSLELPF